MADISGYTAFVSGTEHEHSGEILAELIENIAKSFGGRLSIDQVEGDALCCTTARTDVEVGDWLRETFVAFHRRLRDMRAATTCPCRACQMIGDLGLKFVVHRGTFSRQVVAGVVHLHGADVNLVHRLLKNTVPLREYLLATDTALAAWPENARAAYVRAPQHYDIGDVEAAYLDLAPVRVEALREERQRVRSDEAKLRVTRRFDAPPERVWQLMIDPVARIARRRRVPLRARRRSRDHLPSGERGAAFRAHDHRRIPVRRADLPDRPGRARGDGTRVDSAIFWDEPSGLKARFGTVVAVQVMKRYFGRYNDNTAAVLTEPAATPA